MKILQPQQRPVPTKDENWKIRLRGEYREGDLRIFITHQVLTEITEYSKKNLSRELGGVMFGGYHIDEGQPYIIIDGYIAAKLGESRSASFKFTHDAWSEINRIKEERFPEKVMVGWHHTHPSFGLFLSSMDLFIHKEFFDLPWHVAMVVDPCANDSKGNLGFFQWRGTRIVDCGFYVMHPVEVIKGRRKQIQGGAPGGAA